MAGRQFAVLASGSGTNLQAILESIADGRISAEVSVVIADRECRALDRAATAGIRQVMLPFGGFADRASFTDAVVTAVRESGAEFIALAGFMRILSGSACEAFPNAIMNTHPSLLPAFPGVNAVEQALAYGVKMTGCTVHFIDEELDHGPIIAQEAVPVLPGDSEESLHERIKAVEHRLFPEVISNYVAGRYRVDGRIVTVGDPDRC